LAASWHTFTLPARSLIASVHQKQDKIQKVGQVLLRVGNVRAGHVGDFPHRQFDAFSGQLPRLAAGRRRINHPDGRTTTGADLMAAPLTGS
jgi:hypothetical protein